MSRRADFHQADVTRAIKAAIDAGLKPGEFAIEAEGGVVRILTGKSPEPKAERLTPYEQWKLKNGGRAA